MNDPHEISLDENVTRSDMHPADQFEAFIFLNDSYIAGTHLNDVTVIQPIFWRGQRVGFAASRAHWLDVGGKDTGLQIDTTEIYQEGMRWAPTKIYEAGRVRTEILDFLRRNSRFGAVLIGDLHAQIAAGQTGAQRLCALLDRRLLAGPRERRRRALRVPSEPTGRDTRICTLTANALPEHVRESIVAGADRHLGKPLSAEADRVPPRGVTAAG